MINADVLRIPEDIRWGYPARNLRCDLIILDRPPADDREATWVEAELRTRLRPGGQLAVVRGV